MIYYHVPITSLSSVLAAVLLVLLFQIRPEIKPENRTGTMEQLSQNVETVEPQIGRGKFPQMG